MSRALCALCASLSDRVCARARVHAFVHVRAWVSARVYVMWGMRVSGGGRRWTPACRRGTGLGSAGASWGSSVAHARPMLKPALRPAWRLFAAWARYELPARAPPMPRVVLHALAAQALEEGEVPFATGLLLGFTCLLRPGGVFALRAQDVQLHPRRGRDRPAAAPGVGDVQ